MGTTGSSSPLGLQQSLNSALQGSTRLQGPVEGLDESKRGRRRCCQSSGIRGDAGEDQAW